MGDEFHTRNVAQTCLFEQRISALLQTDLSKEQVGSSENLENGRETSHLSVSYYCKAIADAGRDVEYSTIVTCMARMVRSSVSR